MHTRYEHTRISRIGNDSGNDSDSDINVSGKDYMIAVIITHNRRTALVVDSDVLWRGGCGKSRGSLSELA